MRQSINLIPLTKVIKFEQKVDIDVPSGEEGKTIMRTVLVKKDVVVDNTKERMGALDRLLDLEEKEEKFRGKQNLFYKFLIIKCLSLFQSRLL